MQGAGGPQLALPLPAPGLGPTTSVNHAPTLGNAALLLGPGPAAGYALSPAGYACSHLLFPLRDERPNFYQNCWFHNTSAGPIFPDEP